MRIKNWWREWKNYDVIWRQVKDIMDRVKKLPGTICVGHRRLIDLQILILYCNANPENGKVYCKDSYEHVEEAIGKLEERMRDTIYWGHAPKGDDSIRLELLKGYVEFKVAVAICYESGVRMVERFKGIPAFCSHLSFTNRRGCPVEEIRFLDSVDRARFRRWLYEKGIEIGKTDAYLKSVSTMKSAMDSLIKERMPEENKVKLGEQKMYHMRLRVNRMINNVDQYDQESLKKAFVALSCEQVRVLFFSEEWRKMDKENWHAANKFLRTELARMMGHALCIAGYDENNFNDNARFEALKKYVDEICDEYIDTATQASDTLAFLKSIPEDFFNYGNHEYFRCGYHADLFKEYISKWTEKYERYARKEAYLSNVVIPIESCEKVVKIDLTEAKGVKINLFDEDSSITVTSNEAEQVEPVKEDSNDRPGLFNYWYKRKMNTYIEVKRETCGMFPCCHVLFRVNGYHEGELFVKYALFTDYDADNKDEARMKFYARLGDMDVDPVMLASKKDVLKFNNFKESL